ncbi:MAG: large-conductance mechanosensitive channel protein MscL [Alphaproteobacteria bacterium]|nr:large-conductance mechanosensitive channel protein MscL [Alphaproteobacteria bacterium]
MSLAQEFKAFAMRGNVVDLAVGVVIGAAFGKIVSALVDGIIMPIVGFLIAGVNLKDLTYTLHVPGAALLGKPDVLIKYGEVLQTVVDFTIIAFAIFLVVKLMNKAMPPKPAGKAGPSQEELLAEIRDLLKKQGKK